MLNFPSSILGASNSGSSLVTLLARSKCCDCTRAFARPLPLGPVALAGFFSTKLSAGSSWLITIPGVVSGSGSGSGSGGIRSGSGLGCIFSMASCISLFSISEKDSSISSTSIAISSLSSSKSLNIASMSVNPDWICISKSDSSRCLVFSFGGSFGTCCSRISAGGFGGAYEDSERPLPPNLERFSIGKDSSEFSLRRLSVSESLGRGEVEADGSGGGPILELSSISKPNIAKRCFSLIDRRCDLSRPFLAALFILSGPLDFCLVCRLFAFGEVLAFSRGLGFEGAVVLVS
mmetsp:Transcript_20766/g.23093  ORF Transcript_20766/g.23093 Transcript_20766/m.23093 type:complete len:291 (-) Transcript_20766:356-1228(-)